MILECRNVSKVFIDRKARKGIVAIRDINLEIQENEFVCIVGPSGCGKTTLLHLIAGFADPTKGQILLRGKVVKGPSPERGVVFQEFSLFPWKSALENVCFGLNIQGQSKKNQERIARQYLDLVLLKQFHHAMPHELSAGMKQKVALARALALNPDILLMDEPFSNLDEQTRNRLNTELLDIWQREKKTVIFITHSIEEAITLADRIILFTARPGHIQKEYRIDLPRPRNIFSEEVVRIRQKVLSNFMLCCAE